MAQKHYTVLIVSQKAAKVKKLIFSPLTLKIAVAVLGVIIVVSAYIVYDYVVYKKKVSELKALRTETNFQQEEIRNFVKQITALEEQLSRLAEMEKQMERDLQEVNKLRKAKKSPPVVGKKKSSQISQEVLREVASLQKEEVSILERERPRLVSRLHQDLLELRQEAFQREQALKELQEFLQDQKSILLATPSIWPVLGFLTSAFGEDRSSSPSGGMRPHKGVDISAPRGTSVVATADGVVSFAGREAEYGQLICIDHGHGFSSMYGHLQSMSVQSGDHVKKGQVIGTVGLTGSTTGPHLHYEVHVQGNAVNPVRYLNQTS